MSEPAGPIRTNRAGDRIVIVVLVAFVILYCVDAIRASRDILNLILVLPLSVAVTVLCLVQFLISLRETRVEGAVSAAGQEPAADAAESAESVEHDVLPVADVLRVVGLFAFYVLTLPWLGFDIGTCLFLAAFLWLHGERRWTWLVGYSLGFGLLAALFFSRMLPYPMPMFLLGA